MEKFFIKSLEEINQNTNLTANEKKYLFALAISIFEINPSILENISFNGYAECCICIIKENDKWKLSTAERGSWHNAKSHDNLNFLCHDLIDRLFNLENKENVINKFNKLNKNELVKIKKI